MKVQKGGVFMRSYFKYIVMCLLCLTLLIPSACAPDRPIDTPAPDVTPSVSQPVADPEPSDTSEPPVTEDPAPSDEPFIDIDPVPSGDIPAVHPDEETTLSYDLDGVRGTVPAVHHCNIHGYSITYDALHYERRTYHDMDSYWSEEGLFISVSLVYGMSIDFVLDGLMLQENIMMAPESTVIGSDGYPAYTLYYTTEEGIYRQFWVLDYSGDTLLIEQSYPAAHEYVDFHRAVQQAMLLSITLVEHDSETIDALQAVLNAGQPVIPAVGGDAVTLEQHLINCETELGQDMDYIAFTYCDLDRDGSTELILCHTVGDADGWFDILRYNHEDGMVYLYERSYRGLLQLKTDGTFHYSDGASNSGIASLRFEGAETVTQPISWVESDDNIEVRYFVDGNPAEAAAYNFAAELQAQKNSVVWYALGGI